MEFRIADTFTDSLTRLTAQEQKAVKTTAFDLQLDPSSPGLRFHKLDRAKDANFWSLRVNADVRIIVHKTAASLLLCYVDHHDKAYAWGERRKIERHPTTGAMQMVEIRERVEEIAMPRARSIDAPVATAKPGLFDNLRKAELMSFGVPEEWVDDVREASEDTLLDVIGHLPQEAQEALLNLAVGVQPETAKPAPATADPFAHPDAARRFRVLTNVEELERALDYPWEKWAVFLHPAQQQLVTRSFSGPARVSGSAGTGKTIVALHRAVHLARKNPNAKVLLTTFTAALANALKGKLKHLAGNEPAVAARITVQSLNDVGHDLYAAAFGEPAIASAAQIKESMTEAAGQSPGSSFLPRFLFGEWNDVVDSWQVKTWAAYKDVSRLGRKTRLGPKQREQLWAIFERVRAALDERKLMTWADVFGRVSTLIASAADKPFDFAVVDEAQDLGVAQARFLHALGGGRAEALFFTGDLGQRIFQHPFSWLSLGLDIRGRSHTLRVNYRTSHQIRSQADRLLPGAISDVDGVAESRKGTVSVFNGPPPRVELFASAAQEEAAVARWLRDRLTDGYQPHEIGIFVRAEAQLPRAQAAVQAAGAPVGALSETVEVTLGRVAVSTMHLAKGLEFRAVAVMACDDGVLPLRERLEAVADDADLEEVYDTERHLLYVACTRARDQLFVTGVAPGSEFIADLSAPRTTRP